MPTNTQPIQTQAQINVQELMPYVENMAGLVAMTRYCAGYLDGLQLALAICEEVNKHANA